MNTNLLPKEALPDESRKPGINRFKELTQDLSKYSPEEQRKIKNAWIDYKWENPYTVTDQGFDAAIWGPAAFIILNSARTGLNVAGV